MNGCSHSDICQGFHAVIDPAFGNIGSRLHGYYCVRIPFHTHGGGDDPGRIRDFFFSVSRPSGAPVAGHCDTIVTFYSHSQSTGQQIQVSSLCVVFFSAIVSPSFLPNIFHCIVSSLFRFCGYMVYQFMDVEHIAAGEDAGDTALQILSHYRSSGLAVHIRS